MLKCLEDNGYAVEWRIINAAEYGFPQRIGRRIFILGLTEPQNQRNNLNKKSPMSTIGFGIFGNIENLNQGAIEKESLLEVDFKF